MTSAVDCTPRATRAADPGTQHVHLRVVEAETGGDVEAASPGGEGAASLLTSRERRIVAAVAEAAMPPGERFDAAGAHTVAPFEAWLGTIPQHLARGLRAGFALLEASTLATHGRPFSSLPLEARDRVLASWEASRSHARRTMLRALLTPLKFVHYDRPSMFEHVGCRFEVPRVRDESPRWMAQVTDGRDVAEDLALACEVVVVGTGAGGAAAAYELARRGRAVLLLEEGDYHRRSSFTGRPSRTYRHLYRDAGLMAAIGNVGIPVWAGRAVGGTTVINSGTCYRAPDRTLEYWQRRYRLGSDFSSAGLAPYYERVEQMLQVTQANPLHLGSIAGIIARGAEHLGLSHHALHRNAPDCDGQGVCCFGCPTGAKRSTDVSYVPEALKRGAQLVTAAKVEAIEVVAGRARGVRAKLAGGGKLTVSADAVVVAAGALYTPNLLRRVVKSPMLGKNLSIHPASKVVALFDDRMDQHVGIPQGYAIDHYADEGLMFEGGSLPFDVAALSLPWTGRRFTEMMERYPYLATFGFMIQDTSRGAVRPTPFGSSPLVTYDMNAQDLAKMQRGIELLTEVFLAAGARRVLPFVAGQDEVASKADLARLRARKLRPGDFEVAAFHPLGTCRIGTDPARSCLGPDHEAHDVASLYVCDGSAVPSSLGVNPQMTIMAMALRAAEGIDARLG
ncbi:MAG TPA: FAD-dependent oxidoreductase [Minicystis sp.]|nr:FAD-dependent oxidoreductase [Minicystis sp.]